MLRISLTVAVILLFVGVSVSPSLATVQPKKIDVEYFDVTTEFVGLDKNITIQLTREEILMLDALFNSFKDNCNDSVTLTDTIELFNDMINKLDNFGLLGNCSIKQVQDLVTGRFQKSGIKGIKSRLYDKIIIDENSNIFCLIAGSASYTLIIPPVSRLVNLIALVTSVFWLYIPLILWVLNFVRLYFLYPWYTIGGGIALGCSYGWHGYNFHPAKGWFYTFGLFGEKKREGNLFGQIFPFVFLTNTYYTGATGFEGVRVYNSMWEQSYYLGFATCAKIGYSPY
jgi:hypothetical protein